MESSNLRKWLFKPLGVAAIVLRFLTSWYITPLWAFGLPYFVGGQSLPFSILMCAICTIISARIWKDYDKEEDGQITFDELKAKVTDDLIEE